MTTIKRTRGGGRTLSLCEMLRYYGRGEKSAHDPGIAFTGTWTLSRCRYSSWLFCHWAGPHRRINWGWQSLEYSCSWPIVGNKSNFINDMPSVTSPMVSGFILVLEDCPLTRHHRGSWSGRTLDSLRPDCLNLYSIRSTNLSIFLRQDDQ